MGIQVVPTLVAVVVLRLTPPGAQMSHQPVELGAEMKMALLLLVVLPGLQELLGLLGY